jgi:hypothetical protein
VQCVTSLVSLNALAGLGHVWAHDLLLSFEGSPVHLHGHLMPWSINQSIKQATLIACRLYLLGSRLLERNSWAPALVWAWSTNTRLDDMLPVCVCVLLQTVVTGAVNTVADGATFVGKVGGFTVP